jgi:hypothetical protein
MLTIVLLAFGAAFFPALLACVAILIAGTRRPSGRFWRSGQTLENGLTGR